MTKKRKVTDTSKGRQKGWNDFTKTWDLGPWNCGQVNFANLKMAFDSGYRAAMRSEARRGK